MDRKILLALLLAIGGMSFSAGVIISDDASEPDPVLLNHYVNATIENGIATVSVSQEFRNVGQRDMAGEYIFPLPKEGVSAYGLSVDGKEYDAKVKDADEAAEEYRIMVAERNDTTLLRLLNRDTLSSGIFLPKGRTVRISVEYKQAIERSAGVSSFSYPLHPDRYTIEPIDPVNITVDINDPGGISFVYSPTHEIETRKLSENETVAGYYESNAIPNKDFLLFFGTIQNENDMKMLTHRERGGDGYFLLFLYPTLNPDRSIPKDVVFVIDTSGSMSGSKIENAKSALKDNLNKLGEEDRFTVISFSDKVGFFSERMENRSRLNDAIRYVDALHAGGSTDLYTPQLRAADMLANGSGRVGIIVFLSDGLDTTGHSSESILSALKGKRRGESWRIYPFGLGSDVDFSLISSESNEFGDGIPVFVESESDLEKALTGFYDRISVPALENASLDLGSFAYEVFPARLDNLYAENTVIVAGRYNRTGNATIGLKGSIGGEMMGWKYMVSLPEEADNPFVERAWAIRKIGHLMDEVNIEGETDALKEEIAGLGNRYALATPYTSLLVKAQKEYEEAKKSGIAATSLIGSGYDIIFDDIEAHGDSSYAILSILDKEGNAVGKLKVKVGGSEAWTAPDGNVYDIGVSMVAPGYTFGAKWGEVTVVDYLRHINTSGILSQGESFYGSEYRAASAFEAGSLGAIKAFTLLGTKEAGDKTFITNGTVWVDTACSGNESLEVVRFASPAYFSLLDDERLAGYLTVGDDMVVCLDDEYALGISSTEGMNESDDSWALDLVKNPEGGGAPKSPATIRILEEPADSSRTASGQGAAEAGAQGALPGGGAAPEDSGAGSEGGDKGLLDAILDFFRGLFNFQ